MKNNQTPMIQVTLTNGRETAIVFYEMEIPQAMEQSLIDRPGYWMKDVKVIKDYTVANGEQSFYDDYEPSRYDRRTSFNEEARPSYLPWAGL